MSDFAQKTQDCIIKELRNQVKDLKQEISDLKYIEIANLKASLDEKNEIIYDLKEELEKLNKFIDILRRTYIQIDLLGDLSIERFNHGVKIGEHATEDEIKLITEVLCNERNSNK